MDAVLEWMWTEINARLDAVQRDAARSTARNERAETAGGVDSIAFADLPTAAIGAGDGDIYWITNGRKTGEGAGAGTGVLVYYNSATATWKRISDDVNAAI